jgi:16S rRNA (cytosine967-C5)-methyltransferase
MPISPARVAAYEILLRIEREASYCSELLHAQKYAQLSSVDHGLATELVMGVLRWRSLLDARIAAHSSQKLSRLDLEVLTALRLASYQIMFLDRVPQHAAVNESAELVKRARKRSAVPFVNAVLRKLAREKAERPEIRAASGAAALAAASAHPLWLVDRWVQAFGLEQARKICEYNQQPPETSLRISDAAVEEELQREGIMLGPGRLLASARRVVSGDITQTKAFRSGRVANQGFAIQDEASQLVALLVGRGVRILDCCAAPGGKTRVLAQQNSGATIVAAELHPQRARLMRRLVPESNVYIIAADACALPLDSQFDRVLADVPCSGTGTLARNPEIKWRLQPPEENGNDLADLQRKQVAILESATQRVAPGGRLVYSTCSLEPEEDEQVIEKAMAANNAFRLVNCRDELERLRSEKELIWPNPDSFVNGPYLRTIPGVHPCDGFFAAILEMT